MHSLELSLYIIFGIFSQRLNAEVCNVRSASASGCFRLLQVASGCVRLLQVARGCFKLKPFVILVRWPAKLLVALDSPCRPLALAVEPAELPGGMDGQNRPNRQTGHSDILHTSTLTHVLCIYIYTYRIHCITCYYISIYYNNLHKIDQDFSLHLGRSARLR